MIDIVSSIKNSVPQNVKKVVKNLLGMNLLQRRIDLLEEELLAAEANISFLSERAAQLETYLCEQGPQPFTSQNVSGCIDRIAYEANLLTIAGWILLPQIEFDGLVVYINNQKVGYAQAAQRTDIPRHSPYTAHAKKSGFSFSVKREKEELAGIVEIAVAGVYDGRELARISTWFHLEAANLPIPPESLIKRVSNHRDQSLFSLTAMQSFKDFWETATQLSPKLSFKNMLDWGCGCGRISRFFLSFSGIPEVNGCDIDAEAVAWCQENLKPGHFSVIQPDPPTPYPDDTFDLIIGCSIFTHLTEEKQFLWLKEIQRILAPEGLFLTTVHGAFAARWQFPRIKLVRLDNGIDDERKFDILDGIAPEGYYRSTFHKRAYIFQEWSRYFQILDFKERGSLYFQDMVVMRKYNRQIS